MKRNIFILVLSIVLVMACLNGCGSENNSSSANLEAGDFASQEDFLKDMAEGINERVSYVIKNDSKSEGYNETQLKEYYSKLIAMELDRIQKYENLIFEDDQFNCLAHSYISACKLQESGIYFLRNQELFSGLWDSGKSARGSVIVAMYEQYNLDISAETVDSFRQNSVSYSVSTSGGTDILDMFTDNDDVELTEKTLKVIDSFAENENIGSTQYLKYSYIIQNSSNYDLNMVYVDCSILDTNGNVLGTTSASTWATIKAGTNVTCESSINLDKYPDISYLRIESISYDGDGDHISHTVNVPDSDIQKFIIKIK